VIAVAAAATACGGEEDTDGDTAPAPVTAAAATDESEGAAGGDAGAEAPAADGDDCPVASASEITAVLGHELDQVLSASAEGCQYLLAGGGLGSIVLGDRAYGDSLLAQVDTSDTEAMELLGFSTFERPGVTGLLGFGTVVLVTEDAALQFSTDTAPSSDTATEELAELLASRFAG
jgi:hypothetical protein